MKNKIQKCGLLAGILIMGANVFPLPSIAAEKAMENNAESIKIPDFLSKDYKIASILRGKWIAQKDDDSDVWPTRYLSFSTPGNFVTRDNIDILVDAKDNVTRWEVRHRSPFKMKTRVQVQMHANTGCSCMGGEVTLWFENGESLELTQTNDKCESKDDWYQGKLPDLEGEYREPVEEYRLSKLISSHKPVAITQGKKVILLKAPDEKALKEYRDMITPEYLELLKASYEKESKDPETIEWASHPPEKRGN
ncbi:hypothetical protein FAI41_04615 [Acetobacteraceae bacterium]|nr:hypothetical protein FAI41_04615 [Acetobacteraceae bacterium]